MKLTFILSTKINLVEGKKVGQERIIYVREYIDGDENVLDKNAAVQDFKMEPKEGFIEENLKKYFPASEAVSGYEQAVLLPDGLEFPTIPVLEGVTKKMYFLNLDDLGVPKNHILRNC